MMRHKFLAVLLVIGLYFTISVLITTAEVRYLLKPKVITQTLNDSGLYYNLPKFLDITLSKNQVDTQEQLYLKAIVKAIDPQELKSEIDKNLPSLLTYFNNPKQKPDISISLLKFKNNFTNIFPTFLAEESLNLPPCNGIQYNPESDIPNCLPKDTSPGDIQKKAQDVNLSGDLLKDIPDTYSLSDLKNTDTYFNRFILFFKVLNYSFIISIILTVLFLFFLLLLGRPNWRAVFGWSGWGILIPGACFLILSLISMALPQLILNSYSQNLDPEILKIMNPFIDSLSQSTQTISLYYSGGFTALGIVFIIISFFFPKIAETPKPQPQTIK